jgi:stress response protein YsnF
VKEELVVGKRVVEDKDVVETDVRREEFDIDERADKTSTDTTGRRRDR